MSSDKKDTILLWCIWITIVLMFVGYSLLNVYLHHKNNKRNIIQKDSIEYNIKKLDSIEYNIHIKDTTIYHIKYIEDERIKEANSLTDSAAVQLFIKLVSDHQYL